MKISEGAGAMNVNCNAGTTRMTKRVTYGRLRVWLNENGIVNLISIPKLEADGYVVRTDTKLGDRNKVGDTVFIQPHP